MTKYAYWANDYTGGGAGALDKISKTNLNDMDMAVIVCSTGTAGVPEINGYWLDEDSGVSENKPTVIAPDDDSTGKRWIQVFALDQDLTTDSTGGVLADLVVTGTINAEGALVAGSTSGTTGNEVIKIVGAADQEFYVDTDNPNHLKKNQNMTFSADPGSTHASTIMSFLTDGSTAMEIDDNQYVKVPVAMIVGSTGNPSNEFEVIKNQDASTVGKVGNTNNHANAYSGFNIGGYQTNLSIAAHADLRTTSRFGLTLGGWTEIRNSHAQANGTVIGNTADVPIVFGANNAEVARVSSTGITMADGYSILLQESIIFGGATTENIINIPDNLEDALSVKEGANAFQTFITANGDEDVLFSKPVDIQHTASAADDHAVEIDIDAANHGDIKALDIDYITGNLSAGEDDGVILINIDETASSGGDVFGLEILATDGDAGIYGMKVGPVIGPVHQNSGTFVDPAFASDDTPTTDVPNMRDDDTGTTTAIFDAVNDYIIVGDTGAFQDIELILTTPSSKGIKPTFWYSIDGGSNNFTQFTPVDGTDGCRHTGVISWDASDLSNHVADDTTNTFNIKIIRTRNTIGTTPVLGYTKTSATTEYIWDKDGDLSIKGLTLAGNLVMPDGGTIGQAAGPLLTFDDTNNDLEITGCTVLVDDDDGVADSTSNAHTIARLRRSTGNRQGIAIEYLANGASDIAGAIRSLGTNQPLAFGRYSGSGFAETMRLDGASNVLIGTTSAGASMAKGIQIANATAPTGNVADAFAFYAYDIAAGNSAPHFRTENGTVIKLDQTVDTSAQPTFAGLVETASIILMDEVFS